MGEVLIAGTAALLICVFLSPRFIAFLRVREFGQNIREEGPAGHHSKAGTPTMGGIIIFLSVSAPFLILSDYDWRSVGVFITAILCALLGFADDYTKIIKRRSLGLRARTKLGATILISILLWYIATQRAGLPSTLRLRFVDYQIDLGILYLPLIYLVLAGTTSAVNLTDGLDGLAAGCTAIVVLAYIGITFITTGQHDLALLCGCLVGACIGFLWFNAFPATIFMGDTGSLGLGGAIAGAGDHDQDRGAADPAGRDLRRRGAVGADPGVLVPDLPQARLPDGPDPPSLRDDGLVGDEDHPALLDRRRGLRGDRLHDLPGLHHVGRSARAPNLRLMDRPRAAAREQPLEHRILLTATLCLLAAGAVMVYSASSARTLLEGQGDGTAYLVKYLIYGVLGFVVMQVVAKMDLGRIREFTPTLLLISFALVVLVKVPGFGVKVNGATRWIGAGPLQFQPSELMKIALVLYAVRLLTDKPSMVRTFKGIRSPCCTSSARRSADRLPARPGHRPGDRLHDDRRCSWPRACRSASSCAARCSWRRGPAVRARGALPPRPPGLVHGPVGARAVDRFQSVQGQIAIGSGGLLGRGLGESVQKIFFLPEAHTDFILAVIGEELGVIGVWALLFLYGLIAYGGLRAAKAARPPTPSCWPAASPP